MSGGANALPGPHDVPADLAPPGAAPWETLEVPAGWEPVADLARTVAADLGPLADRIVEQVRVEIPIYGPGAVPVADLRASVISNLGMLLLGIAERRGPSPDEVAVRRELGVRRAAQGAPVEAVVRAYHLGYRELWGALVAAVPDDGRDAQVLLLSAATTVWGWVHTVTDAISGAHAAAVRRLEARVIGARQRFVELLAGGDVDGAEAPTLARTLGFDPDGPMQVSVITGGADDRDAIEVQRRVADLPGRHAVAARGAAIVVVGQATDPAADLAATRLVVPGATVAVGATRVGLHGARTSLGDAERALVVADDGATARFDEVWLWATLATADDRLGSLLAPGAALAASHPHLAAAVAAYAAHGFSVADAARHLSVHANTVGYRLDRWFELTGWDARTFDGLVRSLAAIRRA